MSDSKLLNENTIRRFMKLANVNSLTDNFISEKHKAEMLAEAPEDEELPPDEAIMDDEPVDEPAEEPEMDIDLGEEPDAELGAADISLTEEEARLLIDLGERLAAAIEEGVDEDEPMDDEPMDDEPMGDDPMGDEPMDDEPAGRDAMYENRNAIVSEVLKRVTKRIINARTRK